MLSCKLTQKAVSMGSFISFALIFCKYHLSFLHCPAFGDMKSSEWIGWDCILRL